MVQHSVESQLEIRLDLSEKTLLHMLNAVLDSSSNAIMILDLQGNIVECNRETLRLIRLPSKKKIIGKHITRFVEQKDRQRITNALKKALAQGKIRDFEFYFLAYVGKGFIGDLSANAILDSVGKTTNIAVTISDVTGRKSSENKLKQYSNRLEEHHRFLENVFAAVPDAVTVCDLEGNIIKCNQVTLDLHGYSSRNELMGVNLYALFLQNDRERAKEEFQKAQLLGAVKNIEHFMIGTNGNEFPAELSVGAIMDSNLSARGFVVITKDITERKQLQEKVIVSEKLAAVGRLAAAFSHDIRNPLAVIRNTVCFLEMRLKESGDAKVLKHLRILNEEINYANVMVNDLLDFTRKNPPRLQETNLNETVQAALSSVSMPERIRLVFEPCELPLMMLDAAQLQRVFINLVVNAVQAMPDGGQLTVQVSRNQGLAVLLVSDTGVGISDDSLQKMFTPFFTTKPSGVGLGLSICKQIVEGHGGEITVKSKLGQGSTFIIKLPIRLKEALDEQNSFGAVDVLEVK